MTFLSVSSIINRGIELIYLLEGNFEKAVELYSEAIYCKVPKKMKAVYYCNRALVNIKLENYAVALYGNIPHKYHLYNLRTF